MWPPSMPFALSPERHVVPHGAPRRLLGDVHVGQAMLGEQALLLGDDQRRGIGERDVAEPRALHFRTGRLRERSSPGMPP